jgi:hypothetical protein
MSFDLISSCVCTALTTTAKLGALLYVTPVVVGATGLLFTQFFPKALDPLVRGRGLPMNSLAKDKLGGESLVVPSAMAMVEAGLFGAFAAVGVAASAIFTGSWKITAAYIGLLAFQRSYFNVWYFLDSFLGLVPYSYAKLNKTGYKTKWTGVPRHHILNSAFAIIRTRDAKNTITKHLAKITESRKIHKEFDRLRSLLAGDLIGEIVECYDFKWIRSFWQAAFILELTLLMMPFSSDWIRFGLFVLEHIIGAQNLAEICCEIALLAGTDNITMLFDICDLDKKSGMFTTTSEHGFVIKRDGVVYDSRDTSIFGNYMTHCPARHFVMGLWKAQAKFSKDAKAPVTAQAPVAKMSCPFASLHKALTNAKSKPEKSDKEPEKKLETPRRSRRISARFSPEQSKRLEELARSHDKHRSSMVKRSSIRLLMAN